MVTAFIGLGSNLDDPLKQVMRGLAALQSLPGSEFIASSPLYRSAPMGPADQPDYINAVAALNTQLAAADLLQALQAIELAQGRERHLHWGPRTLDLDILLFGEQKINTPCLTIPHPGLYERNFVLYPLTDILTQTGLSIDIPGERSLADCLAACGEDGLERIESPGKA